MKLNLDSIKNTEQFRSIGVTTPQFDIAKMREETKENPTWLHFGGGNIFRVFVASVLQDAIESKKENTGVIVAETYDHEIIDRYYDVYDNLSLSIIMKANGSFDKKIIASVAEAIGCIPDTPQYDRIVKIARAQSLRMISYTITEKGYALKNYANQYYPVVQSDIDNGPASPIHAMSILTALLHERYLAGRLKLAVVSMDNCSHNGDKIANAVRDIASQWQERGYVSEGFVDYISDEEYISFPFTMIDKITPRPSEGVKQMIEELGIEDMELIVTQKGSYTAPFVNSEVCEYLIIEDKFPNGRVDIESTNVIFTDKDTVNNVEIMKVTTCLNPIHTALAVTGCLLGYTLISEQMKDKTLCKLIERIGYTEGMEVVIDPQIISPKKFIDEVMCERLVNPFIPDTPQRIAMDTSQKVAIRFGETIKAYHRHPDLDAGDLVGIPLALAAWCRYLVGIDDDGERFELSSDPQKDELAKIFGHLEIGDRADISQLLSNKEIFGVDLYQVGLGDRVQGYFDEMLAKTNGVRETIERYL